jgi:hypothetical protein
VIFEKLRGILILLDLALPFSLSPINLLSQDIAPKALLKSTETQ